MVADGIVVSFLHIAVCAQIDAIDERLIGDDPAEDPDGALAGLHFDLGQPDAVELLCRRIQRRRGGCRRAAVPLDPHAPRPPWNLPVGAPTDWPLRHTPAPTSFRNRELCPAYPSDRQGASGPHSRERGARERIHAFGEERRMPIQRSKPPEWG